MPKDILGTYQGQDYFVGQETPATTTPAAPTAPVLRYTNPAPTASGASGFNTPSDLAKPTLGTVDENAIREETRKRMQTSIDAINADYASRISQENVAGMDRSGQTRAINARSGTLGQDFGNAQQEKTTQFNQQQVKYLQDEQNAKVQSVMQGIEDRASAEISAKKAEALGQYTRDQAEYEKAQESARADFQTLAQSGVDLNTLAPAQKAALLKQSGYAPDMAELIYNAMKPKAKQVDYKFEKLADGQGLFYGVDPTTGQLVTKNVKVDVPDGFTMTIAPDGTPLIFNKTTGEAKVAFGQGSFAKPVDELDSQKKALEIIKLQNEINGRGDLLPTEKDRAAFNQIVSKYNASPLIAAADRTIVLKNTVDAIEADPGNSALQKNLAYGYIQALDTYQSAVREGELSNLNSIDSKIGAVQNYIQQIQSGQTFRPEIALEIANAANSLISYIEEGAKTKEKVFESQARVNGVEDAWSSFRGGFQASYDTPSAVLTPLDNSDLKFFKNPLVKKYPYAEVSNILSTYPNATEEQILEALPELSQDKGGISVSSPIAPVAIKYPAGFKGGQCGDFAHKIVDFPRVGDSKSEKIASVNKYGIPASEWKHDVKVGDVIITGENPTYGHVAVVNEVLPNGQIRVTESNYKQSETVSHDRTLSIDNPNIYGAIRGRLKINTYA